MVVNNDRWPSRRFEVTERIATREIQGIFSTTQRSSGKKMKTVTVFAAINRLASAKDDPDDAHLESDNVVATTTLTIPVPATSATVERNNGQVGTGMVFLVLWHEIIWCIVGAEKQLASRYSYAELQS